MQPRFPILLKLYMMVLNVDIEHSQLGKESSITQYFKSLKLKAIWQLS